MKIILITFFLISIFEFTIYLLIKKISFSKWILLNNKKSFFDFNRFKKFKKNNYNQYLGWDKKKNVKNYELKNNQKISYSISSKGYRKSKFTKYKNLIASFGDSYTFCRQSNNNQTWQEYMSKKQKVFISNYGVGNYGLDQAFLKYKKTKLTKDTKIVIFGIVPETICRIQSVWKNYLEFGNIHGFKPYCTLKVKKFMIKENFLKKSHNFKDLKPIIKKISIVDRFYKEKYLKHLLKFPYSYHYLKNISFNIRITLKYFLLIIQGKTSLNNMDEKFFQIVMKNNISKSHKLYKESYSLSLLESLLDKITKDVKKKNRRCIFVIFPQLFDLELSTRTNYQNFFKKVKNKIDILDLTDEFIDQKDYKNFYISDKYGGHFNKKGNNLVAKILTKKTANERNI